MLQKLLDQQSAENPEISDLGFGKDEISACVNRGTVTTKKGYIGSVIGYLDYSHDITSCYNENSENSNLKFYGYTSGHGTLNFTRCYNINSVEGDVATNFTADQLASGELCYLLNDGVNDIRWYQKLTGDDADAHPVLTALDDEANVVNKGTLKEYGAETGKDLYFNSTTLVKNSDATKFYELGLTGVTETAKNNLKSNCPATAKNILVEDGDAWYCGYAELLDGTEYAIDRDYTAGKFTYDRTLKTADAGINTFVLPVEASVDDVNGKVYKLTGYEDGVLKFEPVTGTLEGNTPYLVKCTTDANGDAPKLFASTLENVNVKAMTVSPVEAGDATHIGTYTLQTGDVTSDDNDYSGKTLYGYMNGKFIVATGTWKMRPFRTLIAVNGMGSTKSLAIDLDDEVTGLSAADALSSDAPVDVYTLSGVKLRTSVRSSEALRDLPAGVYIVGDRRSLRSKR